MRQATVAVLSILIIFIASTLATPVTKFKKDLWHGVKRPHNIVHLFEWKFDDIANECEQFLAPNGYTGVQISPVHENAIFNGRPWWERYQTLSYRIVTRSGNEQQFVNMLDRCNKVGVNIFVDVIFNHMTSAFGEVQGTSGETVSINYWNYTLVPYTQDDFHKPCDIANWDDATIVRICQLASLPDLNQTRVSVQKKITHALNTLIDLGVAGFRVDAAKHMWPKDLYAIFENLNILNQTYFEKDQRPFIYQETSDSATINVFTEYTPLGAVTVFPYSYNLGKAIRNMSPLTSLQHIGSGWGMVPTKFAVISVDNHDMQREHHSEIITHKSRSQYFMATAFMLAYPYGVPLIMSSFDFNHFNQGPPMDPATQATISPEFDAATGQCKNGWVCEHRWPQIRNMIRFRHIAADKPLEHWWDNGYNQIAFCRGDRGFIVFNTADRVMRQELYTCLPEGIYCDVISGGRNTTECTGTKIHVNSHGKAHFTLDSHSVIAIHVNN